MNGENTSSAGAEHSTTRDAASDPIGAIRVLAFASDASIRRLRSAQIPQHVGMAAACRALAVELPRVLVAHVDADLKSGVLAERWEAVRAEVAQTDATSDTDPALAALALLLREQGRTLTRHLVRREKEWAADAYRLEGQADAHEAQLQQLQLILGMAPVAETGAIALDAAPYVVAEHDADAPVEPAEAAR